MRIAEEIKFSSEKSKIRGFSGVDFRESASNFAEVLSRLVALSEGTGKGA